MVRLLILCRFAWGTLTQHPRYQHTLDELFLRVYVLVDDWLKEHETKFALPK